MVLLSVVLKVKLGAACPASAEEAGPPFLGAQETGNQATISKIVAIGNVFLMA
jgi:hypothetical protein